MSAPLRVRPGLDEPAPALLNRLALRNGYSTVCGFAYACGISEPIDTTLPNEAAIRAIAQAAGHSYELLFRSTAVRSNDGFTFLGSERVGPASLQLYAGVCPACLEADQAHRPGPPNSRQYMRNWWALPQITSCPIHSCAIVIRCHACKGRLHHRLNGSTCARCRAELRNAPIQPAAAHASSYLVGRLGGLDRRSHALLDKLPWNTAATALRNAGVVGREVHVKNERNLSNVELARIDSEGFELLDDWPDRFIGLVKNLREARKSARFKRLWSWLGRAQPDLGPLGSIFDEMVPGRLRRPPGVLLLSGLEAARKLGVGHGPFERLVKRGVISRYTEGRGGLYRESEIDDLLHDLCRRVPANTRSLSAVPITEAKRIARLGVSDLVRAIQAGQINVAGLAMEQVGLSRILVEPAAMSAIVPGWLPWREVASRLNVCQGTRLEDVVAFGLLTPPMKVGVTHYFSEQALQDCLATYVSVRALRLRMIAPIDPRSLINAMGRAGLQSVCNVKGAGHIYLRSAAEALLPRLGYALKPASSTR